MKKDIQTIDDIKLLVDTFYGKVQKDEHLSVIFNPIIENRWPEHLDKMYRFWETVLLGGYTYFGSPFVPHAKLPVSKIHFVQWQKLFFETLDDLFEGEKAQEAKWRANKMAEMFESKINYYRDNPSNPIL